MRAAVLFAFVSVFGHGTAVVPGRGCICRGKIGPLAALLGAERLFATHISKRMPMGVTSGMSNGEPLGEGRRWPGFPVKMGSSSAIEMAIEPGLGAGQAPAGRGR